jgi:iron complex transport system substrate-binding protein
MQYNTVISLSPSSTEVLSAMGIDIKGRTSACNFPTTISPKAVYGDVKPDYEKITRLGPDMIVVDKSLYSSEEIAKLKATKATVHELGANSVDEFIRELYVLGNLLGNEMNVQSYVDKIRREKSGAEGDVFSPRPTAVLIIPGTGGMHMIAGTKSFQADVVKSIGADLVGPDSNKFEPLNPEFLISQNPGVIITAGATKDFLSDKRFASLSAVKNLKIFGLEADVVLRRGARVDAFLLQGHKALMILMKNN